MAQAPDRIANTDQDNRRSLVSPAGTAAGGRESSVGVHASADGSSLRLSTANLPPATRLSLWYEMFGLSVSRRMLTFLSDDACHMDITVQTLNRRAAAPCADAGVCVQRMTLAGGGLRAERTPSLLSDGNDDLVLHVNVSGRRLVSQLGREATIEAGAALLTSNAEPSTFVLPEPTRFVSIGLPRRTLATLMPDIDDTLVRPLPRDSEAVRLLSAYLGILDDDHALAAPDLRRAVATHLLDLCVAAVGASRQSAEIAAGRGVRAARLRAIKEDIERRLGDGGLSAAALARRHGVSPRYVHKLFAGEDTTVSRYVLGRRLSRVHRMLGDRRFAHRTIGALAFDVGFGDLSTFNREFRRRYGVTPSDVRDDGR